MKIGKVRIHLRHIGAKPYRRPGYSRRNVGNVKNFWNIYLGGPYYLAVRPIDPGREIYPGFFDLGMGRAMLRYRREEAACSWEGTDHYFGLCGCPNKRETHPSYADDDHIFLYNKSSGLQRWNTATDEHINRAAESFDQITGWAIDGGAPLNYIPETIFFIAKNNELITLKGSSFDGDTELKL